MTHVTFFLLQIGLAPMVCQSAVKVILSCSVDVHEAVTDVVRRGWHMQEWRRALLLFHASVVIVLPESATRHVLCRP